MLWYRWTGSEGCSVGNRGKLAKALQTPASVLLDTIPIHSSRAIGLGMREVQALRRAVADRIRELPG